MGFIMPKYLFEISASHEVIVEADNEEEARTMIIDCEIDTIKGYSCNELNIEPFVSDGIEMGNK